MSRLADHLRRELRALDLARTPTERVELALALGDSDIALYTAANGIDANTARRELRRQRQAGRRLSACAAGE